MANLIKHGVDAQKKIAVIGQATTSEQQVSTCSLFDYASQSGNAKLVSPTIVVIGKVVDLHEKFGWKDNNCTPKEYFTSALKIKQTNT